MPFTASSLKDPRVQVHIRDAELFLEDLLKKELLEKDKFDLVISDSSDPEGFAEIFIQDSFYRKVNQVYSEFFSKEKGVTAYPARAAFAVAALPLGAKVEIEAIAMA